MRSLNDAELCFLRRTSQISQNRGRAVVLLRLPFCVGLDEQKEHPQNFLWRLFPAMRQQLHARQPIGRMGRPEEIATAALYLASDEAALITGSTLVIDGGWTAK